MGASRTLVEFYDREPLENIMSLLCGSYDRVVFISFAGDDAPDGEERRTLFQWVRKRAGASCRFLPVKEHTIAGGLAALRELLAADGALDIDITGGSTVFIAAAGALQAEAGEERVIVREYVPSTGACCYPAGQSGTIDGLKMEELLELRGISLLSGGNPIRYDLMKNRLQEDLLRLWEAVRGCLRAWNSFCATASEFYREGGGMRMERQMAQRELEACAPVLDRLEKAGILHDRREQREHGRVTVSGWLDIGHRNAFLYEKAGNLLELIMYRAAWESGLVTDCCTGVRLDWDGEFRRGGNTNNEIDLVLMRGHLPCFVSCKNTNVTKEYLYEIMVMARHFGGRYAVPMVFSSMRTGDAVRIRAEEMGVVLLDNLGRLSADGIVDALRRLEKKITECTCR